VREPLETGEKTVVTAMSIKMRVEIISYGDGFLKGELYSQYLEDPEKPFEFSSLMRMIEKMEEIFDSKRFPEKAMMPRTFGIAKREKQAGEESGAAAVKELLDTVVKDTSLGKKCTFEVSVRFRQNATWQGQILWVEKSLKQNFRSVLEMLKLMDEALTGGEKKASEW